MRAIRKMTIGQDNRAERLIVDHMKIIEALAARDAERAELLVREHTFGLDAHVEKHGDFWADFDGQRSSRREWNVSDGAEHPRKGC